MGVCGRVSGHGRPGVNGAVGVPVRGGRSEKVPWRDGHRGGMAAHEVHFGLVAVVLRDVGDVARVLDDPAVGCVVLVCLRDALEVELVGVSLAVDLGHDVFVVVVTQRAAQLVVVHVGFALALAPALGHLVRVGHLELAVGALPRDDARIVAVGQELQQELPQLDLTRTHRPVSAVGELPVSTVFDRAGLGRADGFCEKTAQVLFSIFDLFRLFFESDRVDRCYC